MKAERGRGAAKRRRDPWPRRPARIPTGCASLDGRVLKRGCGLPTSLRGQGTRSDMQGKCGTHFTELRKTSFKHMFIVQVTITFHTCRDNCCEIKAYKQKSQVKFGNAWGGPQITQPTLKFGPKHSYPPSQLKIWLSFSLTCPYYSKKRNRCWLLFYNNL